MKKYDQHQSILTKIKAQKGNPLWKYYIDSRDHKFGVNVYDVGNAKEGIDQEPGYITTSETAFNKFVLNKDEAKKELSIAILDEIRETHATETLSSKKS